MQEEFLRIINHYGVGNQLKKLSEEVYEFQEAVLQDDGSEEALEHIIEEYADVLNVIEQFKYYIDFDDNKVNMWRVRKLNRTLKRMEDEDE